MNTVAFLVAFLLLPMFLMHSEILRLPCTSFANFSAVHKGGSINATFKEIKNVDLETCKHQCILSLPCKSINYNEDFGICELNEKSAEDPKDGIKTFLRNTWTYYSTFYNETVVGENCRQLRPCPTGTKCVDDCNCPGYRCLRLDSCLDWYKNGARRNGFYYIFSHGSNLRIIICDFETEKKYVWTLVTSVQLKYFPTVQKQPFTASYSLQEQSANWENYRLPRVKMQKIRNHSTHWRATCNANWRQNISVDYIRVSLEELDPLTFHGNGECKRVEYVNIRGHKGHNVTMPFWQSHNLILHTDSSSEKICSFDPSVGSVNSEDNFGYYEKRNTNFSCTRNENASTQVWFGQML